MQQQFNEVETPPIRTHEGNEVADSKSVTQWEPKRIELLLAAIKRTRPKWKHRFSLLIGFAIAAPTFQFHFNFAAFTRSISSTSTDSSGTKSNRSNWGCAIDTRCQKSGKWFRGGQERHRSRCCRGVPAFTGGDCKAGRCAKYIAARRGDSDLDGGAAAASRTWAGQPCGSASSGARSGYKRLRMDAVPAANLRSVPGEYKATYSGFARERLQQRHDVGAVMLSRPVQRRSVAVTIF